MARTDPALRSRNQWDARLRTRGHRLAWAQVSPWPFKRFRGRCRSCGGLIECGTGRASVSFDLKLCCGTRPRAVR